MIMALAKRCPFCGKKLDSEGFCQNKNCTDYKRTEIHNKEKKNDK